MTTKKKTATTTSEEARFQVREQGAVFQIIDSTNGFVYAATGARDEADVMAAYCNENPPEEPSATD